MSFQQVSDVKIGVEDYIIFSRFKKNLLNAQNCGNKTFNNKTLIQTFPACF